MTSAARSNDTRARILEAARRRFAAEGFRAATVRAIAADAGIDPALVIRHFGDKAALFACAIDIDLAIPDLRDIPTDQHGKRLVEHFLSVWDSQSPQGQTLLTLLRSAPADPAMAQRMRDLFAEQLLPGLRSLVSAEDDVAQRVGFVASQMLGLALTRSVLELPPLVALDSRAIVATLGETIQRYLHGPLPALEEE